jgi:hypothetical protein
MISRRRQGLMEWYAHDIEPLSMSKSSKPHTDGAAMISQRRQGSMEWYAHDIEPLSMSKSSKPHTDEQPLKGSFDGTGRWVYGFIF